MASLFDDPEFRILADKIDQCRAEIVLLKGVVAALLGNSDLDPERVKAMISTAGRRPAGYGDPGSASNTQEFFEEVMLGRRS